MNKTRRNAASQKSRCAADAEQMEETKHKATHTCVNKSRNRVCVGFHNVAWHYWQWLRKYGVRRDVTFDGGAGRSPRANKGQDQDMVWAMLTQRSAAQDAHHHDGREECAAHAYTVSPCTCLLGQNYASAHALTTPPHPPHMAMHSGLLLMARMMCLYLAKSRRSPKKSIN